MNLTQYDLSRHELKIKAHVPGVVTVYRLELPSGRMESTDIIFCLGQIILTGDLCPEPGRTPTACCTAFGKDIGWFAGNLSEDYLCSKFLAKEYRADVAMEAFRDEIGEIRKQLSDEDCDPEDLHQRALDLDGALESLDFSDDRRVREWWSDNVCTDSESLSDEHYNERDGGLLVAIQRRFAECIAANPAGLWPMEKR